MGKIGKYIILALVAIVFILTNPTFEQHITKIRDNTRSEVAKEGKVKAFLGKILVHNVMVEQMVDYSDFKVFSMTRLKENGSLMTIGVLGMVF